MGRPDARVRQQELAGGAPNRSQAIWLILRRGVIQLGIGLVIGLAGAMVLSRGLSRALFQLTPNDPLTFAAITLLLTVVAMSACLIPARRAVSVDPVHALRAD